MSSKLFTHLLIGNAVSKSALSFQRKKNLHPFDEKIKVGQAGYAVAGVSNNKPIDSQKFSSEAQAREFLKSQVKENPNLKESLHVLPLYELNSIKS